MLSKTVVDETNTSAQSAERVERFGLKPSQMNAQRLRLILAKRQSSNTDLIEHSIGDFSLAAKKADSI